MISPVDRLLDGVKRLPSIPKSLRQVMDSLNREQVSLSEVIEPISLDPAMAGKVLRLSNSAYFGLPRQVASVEDAAIMVGLSAIRTLVLASGLIGTFDSVAGLNMQRFWRVSLLSGRIAQSICRDYKSENNPEIAYTAGLMRGLGEIAIHTVFEFSSLKANINREGKSPTELALTEVTAFGFHHGEVAAEIVKQWNLPEPIVSALKDYPFPEREGTGNLARVVYASYVMANHLEDNCDAEHLGDILSDALLASIGLTRHDVSSHYEQWLDIREATDKLVS